MVTSGIGILLSLLGLLSPIAALVPMALRPSGHMRAAGVTMGMFDFMSDFMSKLQVEQSPLFDNAIVREVMPDSVRARAYASACHILLPTTEAAEDLRGRIEARELSFEDAARQFSECPSKAKGGDLGTFKSLARYAQDHNSASPAYR